MDSARVAALRQLLSGSVILDRTATFARSLRTAGHTQGGLLLVGTPEEEPWHLTAHLSDESRYQDLPELMPTLVRWAPPPGAPAHLAVGLERLEAAGRGETVFVVAPDVAPPLLLERVSDARRDGAVVLTLDGGDKELEELAHDALVVPAPGSAMAGGLALPGQPELSFDLVTHLVSLAAGSSLPVPRQRTLRGRLARLLDALSGPEDPVGGSTPAR